MPLPKRIYLPIGRGIVAAGLILSGVLLSSCAQTAPAEPPLLPGETPAGKNDPYPDFSKPLSSAMDQMSDADANKMSAQMSALAAKRQAGAISEAEYWRRVNEMRKLSASMPQAQTE